MESPAIALRYAAAASYFTDLVDLSVWKRPNGEKGNALGLRTLGDQQFRDLFATTTDTIEKDIAGHEVDLAFPNPNDANRFTVKYRAGPATCDCVSSIRKPNRLSLTEIGTNIRVATRFGDG